MSELVDRQKRIRLRDGKIGADGWGGKRSRYI